MAAWGNGACLVRWVMLVRGDGVLAVLGLALAGCDCGSASPIEDGDAGSDASPAPDAGPPCDEREHPEPEPCYSGPAETRNVGACREGQRTCAGGAWSACVNERLPSDPDLCWDADCDGEIDLEPECAPCDAGLCLGAEGDRSFEEVVLEGLVPCADEADCVTLAPGTATGTLRAIFQGRDCLSSMWTQIDATLELPEGATATAEFRGGASCGAMEDAEWGALVGPQEGYAFVEWTFPDSDERPYLEVRITLGASDEPPRLRGVCLVCLIGM